MILFNNEAIIISLLLALALGIAIAVICIYIIASGSLNYKPSLRSRELTNDNADNIDLDIPAYKRQGVTLNFKG